MGLKFMLMVAHLSKYLIIIIIEYIHGFSKKETLIAVHVNA